MNDANSLRDLKTYIKDIIKEEWWEESYDKNLLDDPAFDEKSVYVPDDIKDSIRSWAKSMGLYADKRAR